MRYGQLEQPEAGSERLSNCTQDGLVDFRKRLEAEGLKGLAQAWCKGKRPCSTCRLVAICFLSEGAFGCQLDAADDEPADIDEFRLFDDSGESKSGATRPHGT